MTLRTITFDDEQWQVVPRELPGNMIDTINGHIDADSDAVALWRDALIDAPEPPAQRPMTDPEEHIYNACFTYRHDFGLLPINDQISLMREARRWADAFGIGKGESNAD